MRLVLALTTLLCLALPRAGLGDAAARPAIGDQVLAWNVYRQAEALQSWTLAAAAAQMAQPADPDGAARMLVRARTLAAGDPAALAMIEDIAAALPRGAMAPYARTRVAIEADGSLEEKFTFEAGKLAEIGTIPGAGEVAMLVTDELGREICRLRGSGQAGLYCSWTPGTTGDFLLTLYNIGEGPAEVWLLRT